MIRTRGVSQYANFVRPSNDFSDKAGNQHSWILDSRLALAIAKLAGRIVAHRGLSSAGLMFN